MRTFTTTIRNGLITSAVTAVSAAYSTSYSIFVKPTITTNPVYELALSNYEQRHYLTHSPSHYAFSLKPFFQQSTRSGSLGAYFTPGNKTVMNWRENGSGDVDPLWLEGISASGTAYASQVRLRPRVQQGGLICNLYLTLPCAFWLSVNTAFMQVTTTLRMHEGSLYNGGQLMCLQNAQGMLTNCQWQYNAFPAGKQSRGGIDDIQIKCGNDVWENTQRGHLAPYLVLTIPTGSKPHTHAILEPLVGTRNGSLGFGFNGDWFMARENDQILSWMFDFKYRYVFGHHTQRSFDLCENGDWSRYMLVATRDNPAAPLPGINYMTRCARVIPGSTINLWSALHYETCAWQFELGYGFWWRKQEGIKNIAPLNPAIALFDLAGSALQSPVSASTANISQTVPAQGYTNIMVSDATFTPITAHGLNSKSGVHPATYSNTLYGSLGYQLACSLLGIHGLYEWGKDMTALSNWGVWASASIEF